VEIDAGALAEAEHNARINEVLEHIELRGTIAEPPRS
jgi:hypothetical protein